MAAEPMSLVAVIFNVPAVSMPAPVLLIASAADKFMVPAAVSEPPSITMSLPAPVTVTFKFGAAMAPRFVVVSEAPAVKSNNVPADDAPSVIPLVSVIKALAPVVLADNVPAVVRM